MVECSGLESPCANPQKTAENAQFCGKRHAQEAMFAEGSAATDGARTGTQLSQDAFFGQAAFLRARAASLSFDDGPGVVSGKRRPALLVYYIGGETGPIKIGSARDAYTRLTTLQTASPEQLFIYAGRRGYVVVRLFGKSIGGHRIAWAIHHGKWPELMIDHINGVCSDNRIENLREADSRTNMMNMKQNRHNKTGTPGVRWRKEMQKWAAEIGGYPNRHYLGSFESLEEAVAARKRAEQMLGYHPNHGQPLEARGLAIVKKEAANG